MDRRLIPLQPLKQPMYQLQQCIDRAIYNHPAGLTIKEFLARLGDQAFALKALGDDLTEIIKSLWPDLPIKSLAPPGLVIKGNSDGTACVSFVESEQATPTAVNPSPTTQNTGQAAKTAPAVAKAAGQASPPAAKPSAPAAPKTPPPAKPV